MLLHVRNVLDARCAGALPRDPRGSADWADGRITAGTPVGAGQEQPAAARQRAGERRGARDRAAEPGRAARCSSPPRCRERIFPPLFNRYEGAANAFGNHIDNAVRTFGATGQRVRTDLSATLFLSDPAEYDGGELVIEDTFGPAQREARGRRPGALPGDAACIASSR